MQTDTAVATWSIEGRLQHKTGRILEQRLKQAFEKLEQAQQRLSGLLDQIYKQFQRKRRDFETFVPQHKVRTTACSNAETRKKIYPYFLGSAPWGHK